jgi:hypothetical protein
MGTSIRGPATVFRGKEDPETNTKIPGNKQEKTKEKDGSKQVKRDK